MSLNPNQLQELYSRAEEIEQRYKVIQKEFDLLQKATGLSKSALSSSSSSSSSVSSIPQGKYVVFLYTHAEPVPLDILAGYVAANTIFKQNKSINLTLVDKSENKEPSLMTPDRETIMGSNNVTRLLFRLSNNEPNDIILQTQIDYWLSCVNNNTNFQDKNIFTNFINKLNDHLHLRSFLVGFNISTADICLWNSLKNCQLWKQLSSTIKLKQGPFHVLRWFNTIQNSSLIKQAIEYITPKKTEPQQQQQEKQQQNKNNKNNNNNKEKSTKSSTSSASWNIGIGPEWQNKIVTRFPPEPSGYLHIGHAKAVLINWHIAKMFNGKMLVRLDDTNPVKEKAEFEENILKDLQTLGVNVKNVTHTSDYFDYYIEAMTKCIENGNAYADMTPKEQLKIERDGRIENKYRTQSIEENKRVWNEMLLGSEEGQKYIIRMKIEMDSDNGTLRDPTMFRVNIKNPHHRTGNKYKVYPTYDFACPIVDSLEGVTHALRSKEYNERDYQYAVIWDIVCKNKINPLTKQLFNKPIIYQFSRLEFIRCELSKRLLTKLIERGRVTSWDDPRLPTIQGIFRRGLQLEALELFVEDQAVSQRNNTQEWDKLWRYNTHILDPKVPRYSAITANSRVLLTLTNIKANSSKLVNLHPKFEHYGKKIMLINNRIWIEEYDANEIIKKGNYKKIILQQLGVINIDKIITNESEKIIEIIGHFDEQDKKFDTKTKPVISWISDMPDDNVPLKLVELDYLFTSDGEENEKETWFETLFYGEAGMSLLGKGEVIQIYKRGYYIIDKPYLGRKDDPAVLIFIPDGNETAMSALSCATNKVAVSTR